jgi:hypothetical protein
MARISKLSTDEEFALEARRERLLRQRWDRYRSVIITLAFALAVLSSHIPWPVP